MARERRDDQYREGAGDNATDFHLPSGRLAASVTSSIHIDCVTGEP
jgi:hypothetical protein